MSNILNRNSTGSESVLPLEYSAMIQRPIEAEAIAQNPSVVTAMSAGSAEVHVPILDADATVDWIAEGDEFTGTNPNFDYIRVNFQKVGGVNAVTREMANDSNPESSRVIMDGLARDIVRGLDEALFSTDNNPNKPKGLGHITPTDVTGALNNLDIFADAIAAGEAKGATISAFLMHPDDALVVRKLKSSDGSNAPLLGADPTNPTATVVFGVPIITSKFATPGTAYAVDSRDILVYQREGIELALNDSVYFLNDMLAIRATARYGFAIPTEDKIIRITFTADAEA